MLSARKTLSSLLQGNLQHVKGRFSHSNVAPARRKRLVERQQPGALILGCSDSRVPPELIFNCGLGDLFVVRTAGHVLDSAGMATLHYGIGHLEIPLVLVLGHAGCGAVQAALQAHASGKIPDGKLGDLVRHIRPALFALEDVNGMLPLEEAVKARVLATVQLLQHDPLVAKATQENRLLLAGAFYALRTGRVEVINP